MILSKKEILKLIKSGKISINPFNEKNLGAVSYDLTLSNEFRIFKKKAVDIQKDDFKDVTSLVKKDKIILKPGQLILGITKERISLPLDICGRLNGRSRYARLGLLVHVSSDLVQPGVDNKQVLEIKNDSNNNLTIHSGIKICQLIFYKVKGKTEYTGKYSKQISL